MTPIIPFTEHKADATTASAPPTDGGGSPGNEVCAGANRSRSVVSGATFLSVNIALVLVVAISGSGRHSRSKETFRPAPLNEPIVVLPRYDDSEIISDSQLQEVLHALRPALRNRSPKINHVDHALRLWGVTASFADPDCFSGTELRSLLTDHRYFQEHWGPTARPFLLPNTRSGTPLIAFRTRSGSGSSSHVDHTLACLAEASTPLDYPLNTPSGELPLKAAFDLAFSRFRLNQGEYEWSTLAFLHYLPHEKGWRTTEGQNITWDMIVERMMRQKLAQGSCYGNHRLHTLACLLRVDEDKPILSGPSRAKLVAHLKDVTERLIRSQHADGFWTRSWPGDEWDGNSDATTFLTDPRSERILATGHALEWWAFAPESVLPPRQHIVSAGQWLAKTIDSMSESEISKSYTFLTHAGRALALWRGGFPADIYRPGELTTQSEQASPDNNQLSSGGTP